VSFDGSFQRLYPAVVAGGLCFAAYLQAGGISSLVAARLPAPMPSASPAGKPSPSPRATARQGRESSAILARNAFDSRVGPLDGSATPPPTAEPVVTSAPLDPSDAPPCSSGSVVLITESDDPDFSFALLKGSSGSKMRRVGDDLDGKKVELIAWDRVVLGSGSDRCSLRMHTGSAKSSEPSKPEPASTPTSAVEQAAALAQASNGGSSEGGITKVSDTQYVIERGGPEKMVEVQQAFMKSGRTVDGKGIRLYRSSQSTILGKLGMKKGDTIQSINGFDMSNPDKAIEAYGRLKTSKNVAFVVERGGKNVTIDVTIQ
jgi:general secretion pathway protein C